jgi:hypothetical protein
MLFPNYPAHELPVVVLTEPSRKQAMTQLFLPSLLTHVSQYPALIFEELLDYVHDGFANARGLSGAGWYHPAAESQA